MIIPIEINQSEYVNRTIITMSKKEVFQKMETYKNNPNEIKSLILENEIIFLSDVNLKDNQNKIHYGLVIFTINTDKILKCFNMSKKAEFFIKLKDNQCFFTNKKIPYLYHYINRKLKIL
jgi:hypothetical protein